MLRLAPLAQQTTSSAALPARWLLTSLISGLAAAVCLFVAVPMAEARDFGPAKEAGLDNETPKELKNVGITEHLGDKINLDLMVKNEAGESVPLRHYFEGQKPVLLSLAYYNCPSLCNYHLNGLLDAFKQMKTPLGQEFNTVVVSIDARETPELASKKREAYLKAYDRPEGNDGWHFLVAGQTEITELAKQVGFGFEWDEEQQQWAHAAAAYMITPEGAISRYFYGIGFDPKTIRLSAVEASDGKIGTIVDKLTLFCFHFDPKGSKYTLAAFNLVRGGGLLVVAVLAMFLIPFWWRSRREQKRGSTPRGDGSGSSKHNGFQGEA